QHYEIKKPLQSFHSFNEHQLVEKLVARMKDGETMALVSDAGTPGISDPGFLIIRKALRKGLVVQCLPGPTAFVPALVQSGLPCNRFVFEGFLPHKKGRQTALQRLKSEPRTMIFYESPYRVLKTLQQFREVFGEDRLISVSRELSKKFEETVNGPISDVEEHFKGKDIKGEFVIVVTAPDYHQDNAELYDDSDH